jgi:phosphoenolpyruvate carboxykinase (ATP)
MSEIEKLARGKIHHNLSAEKLLQMAIARGEGRLAHNGALAVTTGDRTGRSPKDRFIARNVFTENQVDWGAINQPISDDQFETLWQLAKSTIQSKEHFISNLAIGADKAYQIPVTVITDLAWHQLFCHHMFIRTLPSRQPEDSWTLLNVTELKTDPARDGVHSDATLLLDFTLRRVLLCGLRYAGEMKKAMFSIMNFLLPPRDVLPMHCAANVGHEGDTALFFGLSGTGKTTLSADPDRYLIGDDEHGWGDNGVFNFEGGCYAKCINLSAEREPVIWQAISDGAVMENVVLDNTTLQPQYDNDSLTQNTRVAYPLEHVEMRVKQNRAGHPKAIIFLTCDLYGVLPPVAKLSGYTALVGSTEVGQGTGIKSTFSTCFGAPFFPRPAHVYADLLLKRLEKNPCPVYLVNTGWSGGAYGKGGKRFDIPVTRTIINAILNHQVENVGYENLAGFDLAIPRSIPGIDAQLLNPRNAWKNVDDYDFHARLLIKEFIENFKKFKVSSTIVLAGPHLT